MRLQMNIEGLKMIYPFVICSLSETTWNHHFLKLHQNNALPIKQIFVDEARRSQMPDVVSIYFESGNSIKTEGIMSAN